jgi:hypothetical protein
MTEAAADEDADMERVIQLSLQMAAAQEGAAQGGQGQAGSGGQGHTAGLYKL